MKRLVLKLLIICVSASISASDEIVINLSDQYLVYKKDDNVLLRADISSGNKFHPTPTGEFRVFQKEKYHKSTMYPIRSNGKRGGAEMNYMLKFAPAIAIHEGEIPREKNMPIPSSHGCVRIGSVDAQKLFALVNVNTKVTVQGKADYNNVFNQTISRQFEYGYMEKSNLNIRIDIDDIEQLEEL